MSRCRIREFPYTSLGGMEEKIRIHMWLNQHYPRTGRCESCDEEKRTGWCFQHHPKPHTRDIGDYREWCQTCHNRHDRANRDQDEINRRALATRRRNQALRAIASERIAA